MYDRRKQAQTVPEISLTFNSWLEGGKVCRALLVYDSVLVYADKSYVNVRTVTVGLTPSNVEARSPLHPENTATTIRSHGLYDPSRRSGVNGYGLIMSTTTNARKTSENSRRPSATSGTQSRAASSRLGARERTLSSAEVIPEDSASNGPRRKPASGAQKTNGSGTTLRQTGRVRLATRENLQVRTRSPVKVAVDDGVEDIGSKGRASTRQGGRAVEGQFQSARTEKKTSRGFL